MFCPRCGTEYRAGFTECSDCRRALVPERPPEPSHVPIDVVVVFESADVFAIGLAKGSLEDSRISFWMDGAGVEQLDAVGPHLTPWRRFLVPKDREAEARELLEQLEWPEGPAGDS